jgi:hypothetical protein
MAASPHFTRATLTFLRHLLRGPGYLAAGRRLTALLSPDGERLSRPPRAFDPTHPLAEDLNLSLTAPRGRRGMAVTWLGSLLLAGAAGCAHDPRSQTEPPEGGGGFASPSWATRPTALPGGTPGFPSASAGPVTACGSPPCTWILVTVEPGAREPFVFQPRRIPPP